MSDTEVVEVQEEEKALTEEEKADVARKDFIKGMMDAISKFANAPNEEQVLQWKEDFGDIYGFGLAEDELFVFRALTRSEHKDALKKLREASQADSEEDMPDEAEEISSTCLLWCSKPASLHKKGGTYDALHQQILNCSNFVDPGVAAQLVFKL